MTNKRVEELIRDQYCLRDCDYVEVEFMASYSRYEEFQVTDVIEQSGTINVRVSKVVVESGEDDLYSSSIITEHSY